MNLIKIPSPDNSIREWSQRSTKRLDKKTTLENKQIREAYTQQSNLKTVQDLKDSARTVDYPTKSIIGNSILHLKFKNHYAELKPRLDFSERSNYSYLGQFKKS